MVAWSTLMRFTFLFAGICGAGGALFALLAGANLWPLTGIFVAIVAGFSALVVLVCFRLALQFGWI